MDWAALPWVALVVVCIAGPWGVVLIVALLRGYNITLTVTRRPDAPRWKLRRGRGDDSEG